MKTPLLSLMLAGLLAGALVPPAGVAAPPSGAAARKGANLLVNGSFDNAEDPLKGWVRDFQFTGNTWYTNNHTRVSVISQDGAHRSVLRLTGTRDIFWGSGQGVKVDSEPIPFDPNCSYHLSAEARTTEGPNCRIYIQGFQWKPGVKPNTAPTLADLRLAYKQGSGNLLYFGTTKHEGPFSNVTKSWQRGETTFPSANPTSAALAALKRVEFIIVHIVAIDGHDGDLLVDNVVLEKTERPAKSGGSR